MRYIITQSQLHQVVYRYLDSMFKGVKENKITNPHNPNAYRIELITPKRDDTIKYYYFGEGLMDDEYYGVNTPTKHFGHGYLHIHPNIVDELRQLIKIRETKVIDIVADWFSEKFQVDIDEASMYPKRKNTPVY